MPIPGRARMLAAAAVIANEARVLAAPWSVQIPPTMRVTATESTALISSGVGPSYPNEVIRVRHPVFETPTRLKVKWVTNEHRPFLAPAAESKADDAAAVIAMSIDDFCRSLGFTIT